MSEAPKRIWVLWQSKSELETTPCVWRHGSQDGDDVEYFRADLYEQLERERDEARKAYKDLWNATYTEHVTTPE